MSIEPVIIIATIANVVMIACNVIFMICRNVAADKSLVKSMSKLNDEAQRIKLIAAETESHLRKYSSDAKNATAHLCDSMNSAKNKLADLTNQFNELTEKYGITLADVREFTCEVCCDSDTEESTTALRTLDNKTKELVRTGYEIIDSGTRIKRVGNYYDTATVVYIKYRTNPVKV